MTLTLYGAESFFLAYYLIYYGRRAPLQKTAQKAPVFQVGDEWAFLVWDLGRGVLHSIVDSTIL
jgi:hypothetical protein